jgi:hypothetical protein
MKGRDNMTERELRTLIDAAVTAHLEDDGDPASIADLLREIANEVCGD